MNISHLAPRASSGGALPEAKSARPKALATSASFLRHFLGGKLGKLVLTGWFGLVATQAFSAPAVTLAWDANTEPDIAGYELSYGQSPGNYSSLVNVGNNTSTSLQDLTQGATYYFVVSAYDTAGLRSLPSTEISHTVATGTTSGGDDKAGSGPTIHYVDSEEADGYAARYAIDGDPNTFWHTAWRDSNTLTPPPHELQIKLGTVKTLRGFRYLPRQDNYGVGDVGQYEFYVSSDGVNWGTSVASGTFSNTKAQKEVLFAPKSGQFVRFRALTEANGGTQTNIAELTLLEETPGDPSNKAPVATAGSVTTIKGTPVAITLTGTDSDGDALTFAVSSGGPSNGSLSGSPPNLVYTPSANFHGSDSFTFLANDGAVDSAAATISITVTNPVVNKAPVAFPQSVGTPRSTPVAITLAGADSDGDALTYTVVNGPSKGTLSGTSPNLIYTPAGKSLGSDSFTFLANDGVENSAAATISIMVNNPVVNKAPVAVSQSVSTLKNTPVAITLTGTDPDGDALTFAIHSAPSNGSLSGSPPNLVYTPSADFHGSDSFTFLANDGVENSAAATISITVNNSVVNKAPVAVSQSVSTLKNTPVAITLTGTDPDGDALTFAVGSAPSNGSLSGSPPNLVYTPSADFHGSDSFTFLANDGAEDSAAATVSITVTNPVNSAPVFAEESLLAFAIEGKPFTGQVVATDPDGGKIVYKKMSGPSWLAVSSSGALRGTPKKGTSGDNVFTIRATNSAQEITTASLTIRVSIPNLAPTFASATIKYPTGTEDTDYVSESLAAIASDPNGDEFTISKVSGPKWLEIDEFGNVTGTPPRGSAGKNVFKVRVTDSLGASATSKLVIVIHVNSLPLPWKLDRVGKDNAAGGASFKAGVFEAAGAGALSETADEASFSWQTLVGDGEIIARVAKPANTGAHTRVGVMIRKSLAPNSRSVFFGVNGQKDYEWMHRANAGGKATHISSKAGKKDKMWLRLVRDKQTVTAYTSNDGISWTPAGSSELELQESCYIGLSVSSGNKTKLNKSKFKNVQVIPRAD